MSPVQDPTIIGLQRQLDECRAERDAALAVQAALAEVMEIIKRNPGNLTPVFDAILAAVLRLAESSFGRLHTYDEGGIVRTVAAQGPDLPPDVVGWTFSIDPGTLMHRLVLGEDIASMADIRDDEAYRTGAPSQVRFADVFGARSQLIAALRKERRLLGFINLFRTEVLPFTEAQIAIVKAFAAQAVIAMENARLLTEQREALEHQTAAAEVLQVINANPGDIMLVFNAILQRAHTVCGADGGVLYSYDGIRVHALAVDGYPPEYAAEMLARPPRPPTNTAVQQMIETGQFVQARMYRSSRNTKVCTKEISKSPACGPVPQSHCSRTPRSLVTSPLGAERFGCSPLTKLGC